MRDFRPYLSIVVPVYNETASLDEFAARLDRAFEGYKKPLEVVFVDDGSTDGTWEKVESFRFRDRKYRTVKLEQNCGREAALCAAIRFSSGRYCATISADLQYDPADILKLVADIELGGCDLVAGYVESSTAGSEPYRKTDAVILGRATAGRLKDPVCSLRIYSRKLIDRAQSYYGNTYSPQTLLPRMTHSYRELAVTRSKRFAGENRLPRGPHALSREFGQRWNQVEALSTTGIAIGAVIAVAAIVVAAFGGIFGIDHPTADMAQLSDRLSIAILIVGILAGAGIALLSWMLRSVALTLLPAPEPVRYNAVKSFERPQFSSSEQRGYTEGQSSSNRAPRQWDQRDDRGGRYDSRRVDREAAPQQPREQPREQPPVAPKQPDPKVEIPVSNGPLSFENVVQIINRNNDKPAAPPQQPRPQQQRQRPAQPQRPRAEEEPRKPTVERFGGEFDDIDELDDDSPVSARFNDVVEEPVVPSDEVTDEVKEKDPRLAKTRHRYYPRRRRRPSGQGPSEGNEGS